jgi:hypothetical protein
MPMLSFFSGAVAGLEADGAFASGFLSSACTAVVATSAPVAAVVCKNRRRLIFDAKFTLLVVVANRTASPAIALPRYNEVEMSLDAASTLPRDGVSDASAAGAGAIDATADRRCTGCGYDLRGLEQLRCPECGLAFDPNELPRANIPWLKRGDILIDANATGGHAFIAYWRTVWLVLARPKKFGEMVWQDVDVDAAETTRFRWITIGIALGSLLATMLPVFAPLSPAVLITLVVLSAPIVAFFWMATGRFDIIQFIAPRFVQEMRYRRLHDLSCAGLALAPIVPMFLLLGLIMGWPGNYVGPRAVGLCWVVVIAWWYGSLRFQIHGGRCRTGDAILHGLMMPFAWFMIAAVILIFALGIMGLVLGMLR